MTETVRIVAQPPLRNYIREALLMDPKLMGLDTEYPEFETMTRFDFLQQPKARLEKYWRRLITYATQTIYHPVGTCKMGPKTDHMAVVDPSLRVHGVTGLRVADASIMPHLTSANTNAACIMIGEKLADLLRRDA